MIGELIRIVSGKFPAAAGRLNGLQPAGLQLRGEEEHSVKPGVKDLLHPATAVALSFGLGLVRVAPGTFGALGAFPLHAVTAALPWVWQLALVAVLFVLGCGVCGSAARRLGSDDPSAVVWDETVGMLITLVLTPATPVSWLLGFVFFRILDISKPGPIGWAERRFAGGFGIMADDGLSGLGAAAAVWLLLTALARLTSG